MKNYMNALLLLRNDHIEIKRLFEEYDALHAKDYENKKRIADLILYDLEFHTKIEEKIFYPIIEEELNDDGKKLFITAFQGHCVVKYLIEDLERRAVSDPEFDIKFRMLRENVQYYIEEESELFSAAEDMADSGLSEMAEESYSLA